MRTNIFIVVYKSPSMKYFYKLLFAPLAIVMVISSCRRNDSPDIPVPPVNEKVTASVKGRVVDETGKPLSGVTVKSGIVVTVTDINGYFKFNNIQLNKTDGFVTAELSGYFKGIRTFIPNTTALNYVQIQLIPKIVKGSFAATSGGTVSIQTGATVSLPSNGVVNAASNITYTGTVNVVGAYLDPTAANLASVMPGNLMGVTSTYQRRLLQTYGMMVVELEGGAGEKLQIASGKTATLTMPIPASLQGSAPSSIPLWYFNDSTGLWKEEGVATKQGNNYVGTVTHFSFWNCDVPNNYVTLSMTLKDQNGNPLPFYKVKFTNTNNGQSTWGWSDSSGFVSGAVPLNVTLQMQVYNNCDAVIYSQNIGPFSANTNLGIITVNITNIPTVTFSGAVINCQGYSVTNGYIQILLDGVYTMAPVNNGLFSVTIERCNSASASATLTAIDIQTSEQSNVVNQVVTTGAYIIPVMNACGNPISQYINYTLINSISGDTTRIYFSPPADTLQNFYQGSSTRIEGARLGAMTPATFFIFPGTSVGNFPVYLKLNSTNKAYMASGGSVINISHYGSVGGYITGSFSGNMYDSSGGNALYKTFLVFTVKRTN